MTALPVGARTYQRAPNWFRPCPLHLSRLVVTDVVVQRVAEVGDLEAPVGVLDRSHLRSEDVVQARRLRLSGEWAARRPGLRPIVC